MCLHISKQHLISKTKVAVYITYIIKYKYTSKQTCNNSLVTHDSLHVSWAQFLKSVISGSEQSEVAGLVQLVHHARSQRCSLRTRQ